MHSVISVSFTVRSTATENSAKYSNSQTLGTKKKSNENYVHSSVYRMSIILLCACGYFYAWGWEWMDVRD